MTYTFMNYIIYLDFIKCISYAKYSNFTTYTSYINISTLVWNLPNITIDISSKDKTRIFPNLLLALVKILL